jgi:hypothetical protein
LGSWGASDFLKKFIIIGFVVMLAIASLLLWQCFKHSRDARMGRQIAGTWINRSGLFTLTLSSDGTFSSIIGHSNALVTYEGTWLVKDEEMVTTVTNAVGTGNHKAGPVGSVDCIKIIHMDEHQLIYKAGGQTITLNR